MQRITFEWRKRVAEEMNGIKIPSFHLYVVQSDHPVFKVGEEVLHLDAVVCYLLTGEYEVKILSSEGNSTYEWVKDERRKTDLALAYLLTKVIEAKNVVEAKYKADYANASWYNNNIPGVGQTTDYMPTPLYPKELTILEKILAEYKAIYG